MFTTCKMLKSTTPKRKAYILWGRVFASGTTFMEVPLVWHLHRLLLYVTELVKAAL